MKLCIIAIAVTVGLLLLSVPLGAAIAKSRITAGEPIPLDQLRSLGNVIADAKDGRVHIIYVHGMRAEKPGASAAFRNKLMQSFGENGTITKAPSERLNLRPWPSEARVGGELIWETEAAWLAGQPFIDRYTLQTSRHNVTITIDEVNWWPLLFPLKCRMLLKPEALVAGVDATHLEFCHRDIEPYHRWISTGDYEAALGTKPALGGAASANKYVKQQILDWGMSDAVIATGPMRVYLNAAIDAAFTFASTQRAQTEYVVIAESLGSFVVLDAYAEGKPAVVDVLNAAHNLYFFANQFALLELSRITNLPIAANNEAQGFVPSGAPAPTQSQNSPLTALCEWAAAPPPTGFFGTPKSAVKQIIAFSDPSDALTFRVPAFGDTKVSNVYVRNAGSFLGLFANPIKAHTAQMDNAALWNAMVRENAVPPVVAGVPPASCPEK